LPEWNGEGSVEGWILDELAPALNRLVREYRESFSESDWQSLMGVSQLLLATGDPPELWSVGARRRTASPRRHIFCRTSASNL
jgi:hypothetical protein